MRCSTLRALALIAMTAVASRGDDFPKDLVRWSPDPEGAVFAGEGGDAWDKKIRERGWILRDGDVYHLWYTGYNDAKTKDRLIGHATSKDGVHWNRDALNPLLKGDWVEDVCVVKDDGTYWMFAEGVDDVAHLLTSRDGLQWTELGPLDIRKADGSQIAAGPRGTPTVWVEGGVWYLFYERGDQGVWLATSRERKVWTNVSDEPVLKMGPEPYDATAVAFNQVFKRDGVYYAIYHANRARPWKEWTTCIARSRDLIHWEKYPGNPIVERNCSSGITVETPGGLRLYTMHPDVRRFAQVK
jgi:hypothetical protein